MDNCQVKKGIFVLSMCGTPAAIRCDSCLIPVCNQHGQQDGPKVLCPDCYAKAHPDKFGPQAKTQTNRLEDDYYRNYNMWYFGTRYHFYNSHHYSPFFYDDYRSFDRKDDLDLREDTNSGSFFDS
jgi:hypothetical protein